MRDEASAMRYFNKTSFHGGKFMSRRDAVVLAGRTLAVLLTVWALSEVAYLPERVHSFLYYRQGSSASAEYLRHYYLIQIGFLCARLVGYSLMARWLFKGGPDIEELLLPAELAEPNVPN
jgi:hypothetical protein